MKPLFSIETVSPEQATQILTKNQGNRSVSERNLNYLLAEMRRGNWKVTGHTIKIGKDGRLLDGQHTLQALVKYGKPLDLCVARNLDDEIFEVLDTGKNRTAADVLQILGHGNSVALSGAVKAILNYQAGHLSSAGKHKITASNTQVRKFVDDNPAIHEVVTYAKGITKVFKAIPPAQIAMLYWVLSKKNQDKADVFFERYSSGIELSEKSPIRILRERFMKDMINKSKLRPRDKMALFIKAWNHYLSGQYVTSLALPNNYEFPKPL